MDPKKIKVLVVEDDEEWLGDHESNLRKQGIEDIITADNSETAVSLIEEEKPTAIFTDGLYGEFSQILEKAQELNIPAFLISGADSKVEIQGLRRAAEIRGARFINKNDIDFSKEGLSKFYGGLAQEIMGSAGGGKEAPAF